MLAARKSRLTASLLVLFVPLSILNPATGDAATTSVMTVDVRDYITQTTPGYQLCETAGEFGSSNPPICLDGHWVGGPAAGDEFMISYSHGITDWIARDSDQPLLVAPMRNYDPSAGGLRCFSNHGATCTAPTTTDYPAQAIPMVINLPVLSGSSISDTQVPTTGSTLVHDWKTFDWQAMNSTTCAQTLRGSVQTKVSAFVADSYDFGGDVGVKTNVLIVEEEEQSPYHWERYYWVAGMGRVMEEAKDASGNWLSHSRRNRIVTGDGDWSGGVPCYQGGAVWN